MTDVLRPGQGQSGATGKLYGVGLGPGDPELMTLKAARLIASAGIVAYPALPGAESFARSIACAHFSAGVSELRMDLPMSPARGPAQAAYDAGAAQIAAHLLAGRDVVMLCEGDPLFYGSFMYILARLDGRFECEVVPGVTSVSACAAVLRRPLAARNEVLSVIPGPLAADAMRARIDGAEAVAILKVGRHLPKIRAVLTDLGLTGNATYIERATTGAERSMPLAEAPEDAPYFSMILIVKGADPWL